MSQQKFDVVSAVETAYQLYEHKHYHQCMDICISILSIDCTRADIWHLAGVVMFELEFYDRAVEYFTQAAQCQPTESYHRINLAESYRRSGNPARCITELENLLLEDSKMQNNSNLHFNLAKAYSDIEDSQSSIKHYTIAIKLDPNDLGAMFNLANAQVSLKHFGEAIELYLSALNRGYLDAGVNLANTYVQIGLFREAVQVYNVLYEHYKDDSDFLFNYANALNYANDDMQHALALYNQAIAFNPNRVEYCINYAHFLLKNLHFEEGFRIYEERKKLPKMLPENIINLWQYNGEQSDFTNKFVLVYHEQGFGDSIMFARFLPLLAQRAKGVCIIAQKPLVPLFAKMQIPCVDSLNKVGQYDVAISLVSLPLALGIKSVEDLHAMPLKYEDIKESDDRETKDKSIKKIGICFSTDSHFSEAEAKSIPLHILMDVLQEYHHNIEIYSLNKAQCEHIDKYDIIQRDMNDFADTYDIIKDMDMVISIDTAVAHLSASMGKHTLVLLHKSYDWRWGNGISTPWYEDVVCMTQSKMGEWSDVAHNIKAYLKGWIF